MSRGRRSVSPQKSHAEQGKCPFLIRLFITKNRHTPMADFDEGRFPLQDEFQAYGWADSTPTSLIQLLYASFPPAYRSPYARYSFRHIYVDASQRGLYRHTELVSFTGRELADTVLPPDEPVPEQAEGEGQNKMDMDLDHIRPAKPPVASRRKVQEKTLEAYGFITGDLLSVCLTIPEPHPQNRIRRPEELGGAFSVKGRAAQRQAQVAGGMAGSGAQGEGGRQWGRGGPLPPQEMGVRGAGAGDGPGGARRDGPGAGPSVPASGGQGPDAERWGHIADERRQTHTGDRGHHTRPPGADGPSGGGFGAPRGGDMDRAPPPHLRGGHGGYGPGSMNGNGHGNARGNGFGGRNGYNQGRAQDNGYGRDRLSAVQGRDRSRSPDYSRGGTGGGADERAAGAAARRRSTSPDRAARREGWAERERR